jgi:hypothetical protein
LPNKPLMLGFGTSAMQRRTLLEGTDDTLINIL